jgi:hypothetical protein
MVATTRTVTQCYSGKPGCACGCRGKHYRPEDAGFKAMKAKIERMIASPPEGAVVKDEGSHTVVFTDGRWWVLYFNGVGA